MSASRTLQRRERANIRSRPNQALREMVGRFRSRVSGSFSKAYNIIVVLDDASEEEREDLFSKTTAKDSDQLRKSRQERAENLKKMMEDDDGRRDMLVKF